MLGLLALGTARRRPAAAAPTERLDPATVPLPAASRAPARPSSASSQPTIKTVGPAGLPLISGGYQPLREIGSGGMGVVFEALDLKLDRRVAIKHLRPEISSSPRGRERFLAEARTVAKLQHPNIVGIHAILEEESGLYLVFEYVEGKNLDELLAINKRLDPRTALRVFQGVADAVDYAHSQRVIHRDLKPSNIMVDREGRPKVMDFGIAHQARSTISQVTTVEAAGTFAYMPPEQGLGRAVRESDVYAFAAVAYEALTGDLPFPGPDFQLQKNAMAFRKPSEGGLPGALDAVFDRAFQVEPKRRFATTRDFVATLSQAVPA